jgi:ubiquinone/menaquinone biosynthesis C-methylase UbiE
MNSECGSSDSVREAYAGGILTTALDPSTQPAAIRDFLQGEIRLFEDLVAPGMTVVDVGCGNGRHLALVANRLSSALGIDYEHTYIADACGRGLPRRVCFVVADAAAIPTTAVFDMAFCLTNTWGTMTDKSSVLAEMRRLAPRRGTRVISVFSSASVPARCEWYENMGHEIDEVTDEAIVTRSGFRSEVFSEDRLRYLVGECELRPLAGIGYAVFA